MVVPIGTIYELGSLDSLIDGRLMMIKLIIVFRLIYNNIDKFQLKFQLRARGVCLFKIHNGVRTKQRYHPRIIRTTTIMDLPAVAVGSCNDSPPQFKTEETLIHYAMMICCV